MEPWWELWYGGTSWTRTLNAKWIQSPRTTFTNWSRTCPRGGVNCWKSWGGTVWILPGPISKKEVSDLWNLDLFFDDDQSKSSQNFNNELFVSANDSSRSRQENEGLGAAADEGHPRNRSSIKYRFRGAGGISSATDRRRRQRRQVEENR